MINLDTINAAIDDPDSCTVIDLLTQVEEFLSDLLFEIDADYDQEDVLSSLSSAVTAKRARLQMADGTQ